MIQHIINILYRYPLSTINKYKRFGGYFNYRGMLHSQRQMKKASLKLSPVLSNPIGPAVYFLTGKNYLYQTLFCVQSLSKVTKTTFKMVLVDDGSFDYDLIQTIHRQLPGATIITQSAIEKNLDDILPDHLFAAMHQKRKVYPHIKKLMDIHTLPGTWKLVLDSDMLFWANPEAIISWLKNPRKPIYMQDCQNSYGYSKELMEELCGSTIPDLVNVGAIGLNSTAIDWVKLNNWVKVLEEKEGTSYYLEQALTAMLLSETEAIILPGDEYIVNPDIGLINNKTGALHHYVDLSKEGYFKKAWKMI